MKIGIFGSSIVSAYWNGAATYYRGMIRAMHRRGHEITFYEPDAYERQQHRDMAPPPWCEVVVYANKEDAALQAVHSAKSCDLVIKASGVGVFDDLLAGAVLAQRNGAGLVAYWDVDAPATLDQLTASPDQPLRALVPEFNAIFTYGGGTPVVTAYEALGARECVPIYNGVDPETHHAVASEDRFLSDLSFLGNRLPDREARVEEFFLQAAALRPGDSFLLGGSGWSDRALCRNVRYVGHVFTGDHNAFNCSARTVLNISRESMARYGFSPATRVFEAAAAGACILTDAWEGIDLFFEPGQEIVVANSGDEVAEWLAQWDASVAHTLGAAARRRALRYHTYDQRAAQLEEALEGRALV